MRRRRTTQQQQRSSSSTAVRWRSVLLLRCFLGRVLLNNGGCASQSMLCGTAHEKIMCVVQFMPAPALCALAIVHAGAAARCCCYCCCCVRSAQYRAQATRGFAVLCCIQLRGGRGSAPLELSLQREVVKLKVGDTDCPLQVCQLSRSSESTHFRSFVEM